MALAILGVRTVHRPRRRKPTPRAMPGHNTSLSRQSLIGHQSKACDSAIHALHWHPSHIHVQGLG